MVMKAAVLSDIFIHLSTTFKPTNEKHELFSISALSQSSIYIGDGFKKMTEYSDGDS